jgi:hypothetical protein
LLFYSLLHSKYPPLTIYIFDAVLNYALNLWFLLGSYMLHGSWTYQTPVIGSVTVNSFGMLLFAPVYALALALVWRRRGVATLYMAMALVAARMDRFSS